MGKVNDFHGQDYRGWERALEIKPSSKSFQSTAKMLEDKTSDEASTLGERRINMRGRKHCEGTGTEIACHYCF